MATRIMNRAKTAAATAANASALPVVLTEALAKPIIPTMAIDANDIGRTLRDCMGATIDGLNDATSRIDRTIAAIREARATGKDELFIALHLQLGAIMTAAKCDLATATDMLDADPRSDETKRILVAQKSAKLRIYAKMKLQDNADAPKVDKPKADKPKAGKSSGASLMEKITVPEPVNADAFHAQILKLRVLLKNAIEHGEKIDGCEADVTRAMQALAVLPTK